MVDWLLTRTMCRQKADERLERNLALLRKNNSPHPEELQMKLSIKPISCVVKSCLPRDAARAHPRQYIDREVILVQPHISTSKELPKLLQAIHRLELMLRAKACMRPSSTYKMSTCTRCEGANGD
jgi:hypothetical protein